MDNDELHLFIGRLEADIKNLKEVIQNFIYQQGRELDALQTSIAGIASTCAERAPKIERMEAHVKAHRSLAQIFGEHIFKIIWTAVGAAGTFLFMEVVKRLAG